jgi:hypothetical protein
MMASTVHQAQSDLTATPVHPVRMAPTAHQVNKAHPELTASTERPDTTGLMVLG